jgi:uncharacterized Fe-S cluster protein YjdI
VPDSAGAALMSAPPSPGPTRTYAGEAIEVHWERRLCIHMQDCVHSLPQVFRADERPWIVVDGADADAIAATIEKCRTGALHYRRLDGGPQEQPPGETTIDPRPNGPLSCAADSRSSMTRARSSVRTPAWRSAAAAARRTSRSATGPTGGTGSRRPDRDLRSAGAPASPHATRSPAGRAEVLPAALCGRPVSRAPASP